jgi:hypothetical protein
MRHAANRPASASWLLITQAPYANARKYAILIGKNGAS